ncbi:dehydrogenase E1 component [Nitzschia inconspicua]|uniref:Dehydrogenase E1 component n=1 Tax=Nitzschia inconspicua TaxID=303405 RepID=A0A9K3LCU4_9STRA|nr:dehydrogenase E1 component [Nitzschia inconspicua]
MASHTIMNLTFHRHSVSQKYLRSLSSSSVWKAFGSSHGSKIRDLPEVKAMSNLLGFLKELGHGTSNHSSSHSNNMPIKAIPSRFNEESYEHLLSREEYLLSLDAAMMTFLLHVNARIASMVGVGYYTIGPCGEEALASAGVVFENQDSTALHYRHTAISLSRQVQQRISNFEDYDSVLDDLILGRARGYTVSRNDPVTGGVHCSIGGGENEFLVTSTLSSQCPPAVGRALGYSMADEMGLNRSRGKAVSFVTIGDGSLHNHHFLSSLTLARHAKHLQIKCPVIFGISDNGMSISYKTKQYVDTVFPATGTDPLMPVFRANGQDILSVYDKTKLAVDFARKYQSPCVLLYRNLVRRFGHAATDRQNAYLDQETIQSMTDSCVLEASMRQATEVLNYTTYAELYDRFQEILKKTESAFSKAMDEPKVSLDDMIERVSVPIVPVPPCRESWKKNATIEKPQVMRKHMTRVLEEVLEADPSVVYLGEDVRHGGYYLVTEGLSSKFPKRIIDFPPDETTLLGAALGFSQLGMTPIVEIPYAKYLDCGADMFYEIAIQHWLSRPKKNEEGHTQGMIIRMQGFDRGLFGGNFHTHNSLAHIPPGVDVVCFSNGEDYVRGFRHALLQAKHGRIVMLVDCTNLLNLRHVHEKDRSWEMPYPSNPTYMTDFDQVHQYLGGTGKSDSPSISVARVAIVSYGNGVVTSLQARRGLVQRKVIQDEDQVDIIDCPFLSGVPRGLEEILGNYNQVLFADICKEGPGSNVFSSMITSLKQRGSLPESWAFVGAPRTYNPLGSAVTFLNRNTIEGAVEQLLKKQC